MTPADDLAVLRAVVTGDAAAARRSLCDPGVDVGRFLRFAHHHQLGAATYHALHRLGLAGVLPPRLLAATKASSLAERRRTERLSAELRCLADRLGHGGVDVLFIKGPLFAERFYGSVDARGFADLDVLLRRADDLPRAEALLLAAGYAPAFRTLLGRRVSRYFAHHFEYRRDGLPLDVHWELQRHFTFAIEYPRMWSDASRCELGGRSYPVASDEYELVLQILGIVTDLQVGKLALRSLVDVYRVVETMAPATDWHGFLAARARERIARPSAYVLSLVLDVLRCHERFPSLVDALAGYRERLPSTAQAVGAALDSRPRDARQKLLAFRLYETSLPAALCWWLVSLPFRLAVYGVSPKLLERRG